MSFNLLYGGCGFRAKWRRAGRAVRTIKHEAPDTFGVQEATRSWMRTLRRSFLKYGYEGIGRTNGKKLGEYSSVFYNKKKFDKIDSGSFWLSEHPYSPGKGWDAMLPRTCSWVKLRSRNDGTVFAHFNTHLDHKGKNARVEGIRLIIAEIARLCNGIPVILTGDLNASPNSAVYAELCNSGLEDARALAVNSDGSPTFHDYNPEYEGSVIDYIFVRGFSGVSEFHVNTDKVKGKLPSDHYPISAVIEEKRKTDEQ